MVAPVLIAISPETPRFAFIECMNEVNELAPMVSNTSAARAALAAAIDLFERLGMRRELAEARAELASLDARERAALPG
jgi:hypothetical protein